uniref:putative maturase n=1 Tax=Nitella hyalina TaxID=181804 RepID=UPI00286AE36F|nr:putative maturase [Nitella hyalina]WKT08423.1 putative maturase [Nitella hyalina]
MKFISKDNEYKQGLYPLLFIEKLYTKISLNSSKHILHKNKKKQFKLTNSHEIFHFLFVKRLIRQIRKQNYKWNNSYKFNNFNNQLYYNFHYENVFYFLSTQNVLLLLFEVVWRKKNCASAFIEKSVQFCFPFLEKKSHWCMSIIQGKVNFFCTSKQLDSLLLLLYQRIRDKILINLLKKIFYLDKECLCYNDSFLIKKEYFPIVYDIKLLTLLMNCYRNDFDSFLVFNIERTWQISHFFSPNESIEDFAFIQKNHIFKSIQKKNEKVCFYSWLVLNFLYSLYAYIHYIRRGVSFLIAIKRGQGFSRFWKYNSSDFMELRLGSCLYSDSLILQNNFHQNLFFLGYRIINKFWKKKIEIRGFSWFIILFLKSKQIVAEIPVYNLIYNLSKIQFCNTKGFPIHKATWSTFSDEYIIRMYSKLWVKLLLYYSGNSNQFGLSQIHYIFEFSCIKTLAFKHKSSIKKTWKQYTEHSLFSNLEDNLNKKKNILFDFSLFFEKEQLWLLELYIVDNFIAYIIKN